MYIVPHLPQMPHIAHTQYVVPHGLHHPHPTPPFHPGSAPHSPIMQPGHNHSYYNSDYHQESNDFVLYDNNGTVTSSPSHHQQSPPPNNYQLYTMPGQSPGYTIYSPPPGMPQRQDSLGNYLSTVFPETNGGGLDNFEGGVTARAMPAELIAEMEENLRRQGRTDTKLGVAEKYYRPPSCLGTLLTKFKGPRTSSGRCLADPLVNLMAVNLVVRRGRCRSGKDERRVHRQNWATGRPKSTAFWGASRRSFGLAWDVKDLRGSRKLEPILLHLLLHLLLLLPLPRVHPLPVYPLPVYPPQWYLLQPPRRHQRPPLLPPRPHLPSSPLPPALLYPPRKSSPPPWPPQ